MNRRQFMQMLAAASVSSYSWGKAETPQITATNIPDDGYKALICLTLLGGNDSWNMLIPAGDETHTGKGRGYQTYHARRQELAIAREALPLPPIGSTLGSQGENPYYAKNIEATYTKGMYLIDNGRYGVHGCAPELAWLYNQNKLSWVVNTGVLAEPVTRSTLNSATLPAFLFAHNHQQKALYTGDALQRVKTGWAGRLADQWRAGQPDGINKGHPFGLNIAVGSGTAIFSAEHSRELVVPAGRPIILNGYTGDGRLATLRRKNMEIVLSANTIDPFVRFIAERQQSAVNLAGMLSTRWNETTQYNDQTGTYGEPMFTLPDHSLTGLDTGFKGMLMSQLETVARMIEIGQQDGLKRQIFSVTMPGFDTHNDQANSHATLLRELSLSLWHFQTAIDRLGLADSVTLFTQSDFGRTLVPNNSGTDHGWGGIQFIMQNNPAERVMGEYPDISEGSQDMYTDTRGRVIPGISIDNTLNSMIAWLGYE